MYDMLVMEICDSHEYLVDDDRCIGFRKDATFRFEVRKQITSCHNLLEQVASEYIISKEQPRWKRCLHGVLGYEELFKSNDIWLY